MYVDIKDLTKSTVFIPEEESYTTETTDIKTDTDTDMSDMSDISSNTSETYTDTQDGNYTRTYSTYKYRYYNYKKNKKAKTEPKFYNYDGGYISEFNKNSSFINMLIERRKINIDSGLSHHIAAFVPNLTTMNKFTDWAFGKLAIGENSERMRFNNIKMTTHAEMDALKKLGGLIRVQKCKKQKMDLVVIRVNISGNLCESAPCYHCTQELAKTKIVSINRLYFSRHDGSITCVKFSEWLKNDNFHISRGWRLMNCCK
jgi:cytidine deaminase